MFDKPTESCLLSKKTGGLFSRQMKKTGERFEQVRGEKINRHREIQTSDIKAFQFLCLIACTLQVVGLYTKYHVQHLPRESLDETFADLPFDSKAPTC